MRSVGVLDDIVQGLLGYAKQSVLDVRRQRARRAQRLEGDLQAGLTRGILSQGRQGFAEGPPFQRRGAQVLYGAPLRPPG